MAKKTKVPTLLEIIGSIEAYRTQLYNDPKVSSTRFHHMQTALHNAKNIVRDLYGVPRRGDRAWIK